MFGLIWTQTVWHSDGIPERMFRFWKKSACMFTKYAKIKCRVWSESNYLTGWWYSWKNFSILIKINRQKKACTITNYAKTKCLAWSGCKLFDTLTVFLKEFFRKSWFWKIISRRKKRAELPTMQRIKLLRKYKLFWKEELHGKGNQTYSLNYRRIFSITNKQEHLYLF